MGCLCVGSNEIKINPYGTSEKIIQTYINEEEKEHQKMQKELDENFFIIISNSQSIDSIKDTSNGDFLGYTSFFSDLEN